MGNWPLPPWALGERILRYWWQGLAPYRKAKKKYKLELYNLGATWASWLPTYVDSKTQLTPKSDNVNKQKFMRSAWAFYVGVMNYGIE